MPTLCLVRSIHCPTNGLYLRMNVPLCGVHVAVTSEVCQRPRVLQALIIPAKPREQMAKICAIIKSVKLAFDEVKATQAAAVFLRLAGRPLNYMALIKLLYRADREAFRRLGLPITTDKYVAMKLGPVTSRIYDLIKASKNPNAHPTFWSAHIQPSKDPREVVIKCDPGDSELSKVEEDLMAEIFVADGAKDRFELADECHRDFPEWTDPGDSSTPIDISDIVSALDLSEDEAAHVATLIEVQRAAFNLTK